MSSSPTEEQPALSIEFQPLLAFMPQLLRSLPSMKVQLLLIMKSKNQVMTLLLYNKFINNKLMLMPQVKWILELLFLMFLSQLLDLQEQLHRPHLSILMLSLVVLYLLQDTHLLSLPEQVQILQARHLRHLLRPLLLPHQLNSSLAPSHLQLISQLTEKDNQAME